MMILICLSHYFMALGALEVVASTRGLVDAVLSSFYFFPADAAWLSLCCSLLHFSSKYGKLILMPQNL